MKPRSRKQAATYREYGPVRNAFLSEHNYRCSNCGRGGASVHEICNGPNRMRAFGRREAWLALCWTCNSGEFTNKQLWPYSRQLWLKLTSDPEYFNLDVINEILAPKGCDNPPQVVSAADVLEHARRAYAHNRG